MSFLTRFLPDLLKTTQRLVYQNGITNFSTVSTNLGTTTQALVPGGSFTLFVRNKIRCYFPRPSERKRIKRHGWNHRLSTLEGRRVLMRRMLKGRHVLSH